MKKALWKSYCHPKAVRSPQILFQGSYSDIHLVLSHNCNFYVSIHINIYVYRHTQENCYGITKVGVRCKSLFLSGKGTLPKAWTTLLENQREHSFLKNCWHFWRQEDFDYPACCQLSFQSKPIPFLLLLCQGRTVRESSSWDDTWEAELHL